MKKWDLEWSSLHQDMLHFEILSRHIAEHSKVVVEVPVDLYCNADLMRVSLSCQQDNFELDMLNRYRSMIWKLPLSTKKLEEREIPRIGSS